MRQHPNLFARSGNVMKLVRTLLLLLVLSLLVFFPHESENTTNFPHAKLGLYRTPIVGGFGMDTSPKAQNAAMNGLQVSFQYGEPATESSSLGQTFNALHMKVIDGYISSYLYYYECHRSKTVIHPPPGATPFCQTDVVPSLTNDTVFLAKIAAHLKQVKDNQLITGYWVLDDWNSWDPGSAQKLLVKIHQLIQQYTPGRPAICGFGGSVPPFNSSDGWNDNVAANFSPQGCDMVGLYIYAPERVATSQLPSAATYDWSMSKLLPTIFASLQNRGWDVTKEPLIGIGQAFGGPIAHTNLAWAMPDAQDIETQSKSFCTHGATGLIFYAWDDSGFGPATQTSMNNATIASGIRQGIAACKQIWQTFSRKTP